MRKKNAWMLAGALAALHLSPAMAADGDGPMAGSNTTPWARWQGRLSLVTTTDPWRLGVEGSANKLSSASLMGDYYFARSLAGPAQLGGLRATSGLIFGPRTAPSTGQPGRAVGSAFSIGSRSIVRAPVASANDAANEHATLPYVGIGYTGLSPRNGWGISADLGLIAKGPASAVRVGSGQSLDDVVRDIRMTPLLQLGISYTF